jgi:sugar/nucleoside kinase (ribokinase family)
VSPTRVLVAGPASWNLLVHLDHLPEARPGTHFTRGFHETVGGTSAGKAMNLARLGAEVTLRTVLGDDEPAARVRAALDRYGVRLLAEPALDGRTERHANLMAAGDRVSVYLAAPQQGDEQHADATRAALGAADAVVVDLADHARPVLRAAVAAGIPVWTDLHDYDGVAEYHREFATSARYVFLSSDRLADPRSYMRSLVDGGAELVVCTHGEGGASALQPDGTWTDVPAVPVERVVDTNGAGDAFFAGFLAARLGGRDVPGALRRGAEVAAECVAVADLAPPPLSGARPAR